VASAPQYRRRLGENIRAQRKQLGLSQERLAERAELHPVYVGRVERGEENVSIDSLMRIAKALKVTLHDLVTGI
jgi:XRE family transcriptional regulator, regulator of sulfur utilization